MKEPTSNITVDSPLVETNKWLADNKQKHNNVDVETFHILDAYDKAKNRPKILSGLFISDQVGGEHPLTDKISSNQAWIHLLTTLENLFSQAELQVTTD